jgi:NAD(P)-dependent dehydrogenase (short-subunit alcohol dehydrogenase family)
MSDKKTILITGCSSGIGAFCAHALKNDGWRVFATARKHEDIHQLKSEGFETFFLDYRDPVSIKKLFDDVMSASSGTLDALFNNGGYAQPGAVEDLPMDALREQFETNFFGWHDLTRRVVPIMRKQGHGRIVFNSSILGLVPQKWRGAYNASKHAVEGLMTTMRMELAGTGIEVSLIEPGAIESKIAVNAAAMADRYLDVTNSPHRASYETRISFLRAGGSKAATKLGPDAVYKVLKQALLSRSPQPHYIVTRPAKVGVFLKRILPAKWLYAIMSKYS